MVCEVSRIVTNKIPGVAMLSHALAHLFGCTFYRFGGDYNCMYKIWSLWDWYSYYVHFCWCHDIKLQNPKGYKITYFLAQEHNIEIVGSASGRTMVEGLNCAWVYLGHSTAKKKVLGSLLHITLPWPFVNSGTLPITSRSCEKSHQALHT